MVGRKLRYLFTVILSLALVCGLAAPAAGASSLKAKGSGHMVGTSGKIAYYAVGIDGGGPLYKYNATTKKKTKLASGKWLWLNVKGKYLILGKNNWGGSDARDYFVYRMKTNGKSKKKLASGSHPVVKGKYIYYFGIQKHDFYGDKVDGRVLGIYRMKLNGKGKKKLVAFDEYTYPSCLAVSGKKLLYKVGDQWYTYNLSTKKKAEYYGTVRSNIGRKDWESTGIEPAVSGGLTYKSSGSKVYIYKGSKLKKKLSFKGEVQKVIASGKQMMVVIHTGTGDYPDKYAVLMLKSDGTKRKKVAGGMLVSGGWDYN